MLASFFVTVAGWWVWNAFLSGVYTPSPSPYDVRDGFIHGFGRDPIWWLTMLLVLGFLAVVELGYKAVKRNLIITGVWKYRWRWLSWTGLRWCLKSMRLRAAAGPSSLQLVVCTDDEEDDEDWDLELWQEMERDPAVKERLKAMVEEEGLAAEEREAAGLR